MGLELDRMQALDLWRGVTLASVQGDEPDLTARQLAVLMTVYCSTPPHTVRGLAQALNVGKPAITRALDTLSRLGLIKRRRDEADGRNVLVQRTVKGSVYLTNFAELITTRAAEIAAAPETQALSR
jgi:DNA-binding MarR family transcriptional regulator